MIEHERANERRVDRVRSKCRSHVAIEVATGSVRRKNNSDVPQSSPTNCVLKMFLIEAVGGDDGLSKENPLRTETVTTEFPTG